MSFCYTARSISQTYPNSVVGAEFYKGNNWLHVAVIGGSVSCCKFALSVEGVEINHINDKGETPLDIALEKRSSRVIAFLREHGALCAFEVEAIKMNQRIESASRRALKTHFRQVYDSFNPT